jgi:hypothetical protein
MVICRFYQQGRCLKGETCTFQHDLAGEQESLPPPAQAQSLSARAKSFDPNPNREQVSPKKPPCRYYQQGTCKRGAFCLYEHGDHLSTLKLVPKIPETLRSSIPCTYFQRNACNKGEACPFSHDIRDPASAILEPHSEALSTSPIATGLASSTWAKPGHGDLSKGVDPASRTISGATVIFAQGGGVSSLTLPSDVSAVCLSNVPATATVEDIQDLMARYRHSILPTGCIRMKYIAQTSTQSVEIKLADPDFATNLLQLTGSTVELLKSKVLIRPLHLGGTSESGSSRLQLSTVACSWYNPSRVVYLHYRNDRDARPDLPHLRMLGQKQIDGRKLGLTYQPVRSVQVANVNPTTTKLTLQRILREPLPEKLVFGALSHTMSAPQLEDRVKAALETHGTLVEWVVTTPPTVSRAKAIAKFTDPKAARSAVTELEGILIDPASKDKLHVVPVISIKMSVSRRILKAVQTQLDELSRRAWDSNYTSIKVYEAPSKDYAHIRVYGQRKESVAEARLAVEKLLAGYVASNASGPTSAPYLFKPTSDAFLESVMTAHGVTIIRDLRKLVLRLYGKEPDMYAAQDMIVAKLQEVETETRVIILDATTLGPALAGGFRLIVASLGKDNVKLDIISNPKRILVKGSEYQEARAQDILDSHAKRPFESQIGSVSMDEEVEELCPVCWTPPEEPTKTRCGHVYCRCCLASQCTSAGESDFPIRCLGASATCNLPFQLADLKTHLAANDYESMLRTSLTGYIRSHPKDYQYCPTPDCDRFYRTTSAASPRAFDCDGCLSSVCTGCQHLSHDGLTCEAYKAVVKAEKDGTDELARWKKENDVRDCPNCNASIEKSYGCNHMECRLCGIHICWYCMKTFKLSRETYDHMSKKHGGAFDYPIR